MDALRFDPAPDESWRRPMTADERAAMLARIAAQPEPVAEMARWRAESDRRWAQIQTKARRRRREMLTMNDRDGWWFAAAFAEDDEPEPALPPGQLAFAF